MKPRKEFAETPARILIWVDCPNCGRFAKPGCEFTCPLDPQRTMEQHLWVRMSCERCRCRRAMLHLVRERIPLQ